VTPTEPRMLSAVCTDKGQHKRTLLTKITVSEQGSTEWRTGRSFSAPGEAGNTGYTFDCPRCPKKVELRPETFQLLVTQLLERGVSRVDISRLPF
jgi:hypothetical protein